MKEVFEIVDSVWNEFVVIIKGIVYVCGEKVINDKLVIGKVEVLVEEIIILNMFKILLFYIEDGVNVLDELCLKYCYLDLWCLEMNNIFKMCYMVMRMFCNKLDVFGFFDIEIFYLMKSMLEGVCDYFVLSCVYFGNFYVLL